MKQVAVFHQQISDFARGAIDVSPQGVQSFDLNKNLITCGLLEMKDTYFDGNQADNRNKVWIRKKAFSCNYRDKALIIQAKHSIDSFSKKKKAKYYTLGSEFVGEVVDMGADVQGLQIGDHVIGNGNYPFSGYDKVAPGVPTNHGSKELEKFHFSKVIRVPKSMPLEVAASFPIGGQTTYSMIRKLNLKAGEKVLVTAATSNTSLFAINALRRLPVEVYAVTTRESFKSRLEQLGVQQVFVVERGLKSLIEDQAIGSFIKANGGFNAVIDPFFDIYLGQAMDVIAMEGRYVTCGMYAQPLVGEAA
ncbi:MAG: zinc-binding alcohol dehydrogenase family protein, partial [Bacteroidota bacterium]